MGFPPVTRFSACLMATGVVYRVRPMENPAARCGCRVGYLALCAARAVGPAVFRSWTVLCVSRRGGQKRGVVAVARTAGTAVIRCCSGSWRLRGPGAVGAVSSVLHACSQAPGCHQGASSGGACTLGSLCVTVRRFLEGAGGLSPHLGVLGSRQGASWALPMLCLSGFRGLVLAGGFAVEGRMCLSCRSLSFTATCRMMCFAVNFFAVRCVSARLGTSILELGFRSPGSHVVETSYMCI